MPGGQNAVKQHAILTFHLQGGWPAPGLPAQQHHATCGHLSTCISANVSPMPLGGWPATSPQAGALLQEELWAAAVEQRGTEGDDSNPHQVLSRNKITDMQVLKVYVN